MTASATKLRSLLRVALDKLSQSFSSCDCVRAPHFNDCKTIALVDEMRVQAGMRRWPGYLVGLVRADHPVRR